MKTQNRFYLFFISVAIFMSGCSYNSVINAPNGKRYYVDTKDCKQYTLNRDILTCYEDKDEDENTVIKKQYRPITFGYEIETRRSY